MGVEICIENTTYKIKIYWPKTNSLCEYRRSDGAVMWLACVMSLMLFDCCLVTRTLPGFNMSFQDHIYY